MEFGRLYQAVVGVNFIKIKDILSFKTPGLFEVTN